MIPRPVVLKPAPVRPAPRLFSRELEPGRPNCTRRACVPQLVSQTAHENPEAIALSLDSQRMTYGELDFQSDRLAAHLQCLGVRAESVVAICLERSFDYVVATLAVWKAGGAYLPLDPIWPVERRNLALANARADVAIVRAALDLKARFVVDLDRDFEAMSASRAALTPVNINRESLAYVIYTSGSTGQPKAVEVTHGNLLNLVFWHRRTFGVTTEDRATFLAGPGSGASVWELWPYLTAGADIAIVPESIRTSADELRQWLGRENVTISFVPAAIAETMLSASWSSTVRLRYLLTGADTLHRHPNPDLPFRLVNNYGLAECTAVTTSGNVPAAPARRNAKPAIGTPIANTFVYLLNERFQRVKPGEIGEMFIGGTGVARGYRNDPDLTTKRFFEDPFRAAPGRMYRTGDLASLLPDGQYAFHGRKDSQETIRWQRVEPSEITSVLVTHPAVITGAVAVIVDAHGEKTTGRLRGPESWRESHRQGAPRAFGARTARLHDSVCVRKSGSSTAQFQREAGSLRAAHSCSGERNR